MTSMQGKITSLNTRTRRYVYSTDRNTKRHGLLLLCPYCDLRMETRTGSLLNAEQQSSSYQMGNKEVWKHIVMNTLKKRWSLLKRCTSKMTHNRKNPHADLLWESQCKPVNKALKQAIELLQLLVQKCNCTLMKQANRSKQKQFRIMRLNSSRWISWCSTRLNLPLSPLACWKCWADVLYKDVRAALCPSSTTASLLWQAQTLFAGWKFWW